MSALVCKSGNGLESHDPLGVTGRGRGCLLARASGVPDGAYAGYCVSACVVADEVCECGSASTVAMPLLDFVVSSVGFTANDMSSVAEDCACTSLRSGSDVASAALPMCESVVMSYEMPS